MLSLATKISKHEDVFCKACNNNNNNLLEKQQNEWLVTQNSYKTNGGGTRQI